MTMATKSPISTFIIYEDDENIEDNGEDYDEIHMSVHA